MQINWTALVNQSAEISLTTTRSEQQIAPELVAVEVTGWSGFATAAPSGDYDNRLHKIDYRWEIRDASNNLLADWTAPANTTSDQKKAGYAYGFVVARVLPEGEWTFTCTAIEWSSGKTATASTTVTVGDPEAAFSNIVVIDSAGTPDYTGKPTGAYEATSLADAISIITANDQFGDWMVLFKRGQTHTWASMWEPHNQYYYLGAWGAGADPVIDPSSNTSRVCLEVDQDSGTGRGEFRICNIDLGDGGWDTTTETALVDLRDFMINEACSNTIIDNVSIANYGHLVLCKTPSPGTNNLGRSIAFNNVTVDGWRDFGLGLVKDSNQGSAKSIMAALGCRVVQNPDASGGGPKYNPSTESVVYNTHGPIRVATADIVVVEGNDMLSNTGWPVNKIYQSCVRAFTGDPPYDLTGKKMIYARNATEGGYYAMNIVEANGNPSTCLNVAVFDNIHVGVYNSRGLVRTTYSGVNVFANIIIAPDTITSQFYGISTDESNVLSDYGDGEINFFSNTIAALFGDGTTFSVANENSANPPAITHENNMVHEPNRTGGTDYTPLDTTTYFFTPRYNGRRWVASYDATAVSLGYTNLANDTSVANPSTLAANYKPQAGSAALGAYSSGLVSYRDFTGAVRPSGSEDIGAWQVST